MYDALQCSFLRIKKPQRQPQCSICGPHATITSMKKSVEASQLVRGPSCCSAETEYEEISDLFSISCLEYNLVRDKGVSHILLDVRVEKQFELCSLPGAINIPLACLPHKLEQLSTASNGTEPIYCICRRGIASITATKMILEGLQEYPHIHSVKNIRGGYNSWISEVDTLFPKY